MLYTTDGGYVRTRLGPYTLGQTVTILCEVVGGKPSPVVTWWRDMVMVDDTAEDITEYKVTNSFTISNLTRSDLHSILTCQASNPVTPTPVTTSARLDMTCKSQSEITSF